MRRGVAAAVVALGLAAVVYGTASLTGGWLGTPPWSTNETHVETVTVFGATQRLGLEQPREGREWISGGIVTAGVGLIVAGARRRRRCVPLRDS